MIILFFDIGLLVFFIVLIIGGTLLVMQEAAVASAGVMVDNFIGVSVGYLLVNAIIAIVLYCSLYGKKELKRHLCNFIVWITAYLLMTLPAMSIVYFAIIPQAFTSLGNMIVSDFFFFLVICGIMYFQLWGIGLILDSKENTGNGSRRRAVWGLIAIAFLSLLVGYFITHATITHTTSSIYIKLYGEKLGGWLISWVEGINAYVNSR